MAAAHTTGTYTHYIGPLASLTPTSPGLAFLSAYLPAIDALDRLSPIATKLDNLLSPNVAFITNGGPAVSKEQTLGLLGMRENGLAKFGHHDDVLTAWDLGKGEDERLVVCEAISVTVFKGDEEKQEIKVNELLMLKLEKAMEGKGLNGWWMTEAKVYMDAGAVMAKAKMIRQTKKA